MNINMEVNWWTISQSDLDLLLNTFGLSAETHSHRDSHQLAVAQSRFESSSLCVSLHLIFHQDCHHRTYSLGVSGVSWLVVSSWESGRTRSWDSTYTTEKIPSFQLVELQMWSNHHNYSSSFSSVLTFRKQRFISETYWMFEVSVLFLCYCYWHVLRAFKYVKHGANLQACIPQRHRELIQSRNGDWNSAFA